MSAIGLVAPPRLQGRNCPTRLGLDHLVLSVNLDSA